MARAQKYRRQFDKKTRVLHVWRASVPVPVTIQPSGPRHEKAADLDEVFRKGQQPEAADAPPPG